jgi:hypothetical protein
MFRNQIVKSFRNIDQRIPWSDEQYVGMMDRAVDMIGKVEGFHFGCPNELHKIFHGKYVKEHEKKPVFMEELAVDVRLPFPVVWFDFNGIGYAVNTNKLIESKIGILCHNPEYNGVVREDLICLIGFHYSKTYDWIMTLNYHFVKIGSKLTHQERTSIFKSYYPFWNDEDCSKAAEAYETHRADSNHMYIPTAAPESFDKIPQVVKDWQATIDNTLLTLTNLSLMLLNCKNVKTIKTNNLEFNRVKQHSKKKKKVKPIHEYYILDIMKPTIIHEANNSHNGNADVKNRVHVCRGHFKNRKSGRYWWSAHVRGNVELGTINKDYNVKHQSN